MEQFTSLIKILRIINKMDSERYNKVISECMKLVIDRNKKYGDSVDVIDIHTLVGLVIMKLTRIYRLGDNAKTKDELMDSINYLVFALEKYNKRMGK
jgi:hypothetical protein